MDERPGKAETPNPSDQHANGAGYTEVADAALGGMRTASDLITDKLGLDRIEGFSFAGFFSEVFKKHDPNEVETLFTVGSSVTTPHLHPHMAELPNPWLFFRVLVGTLAVYLIFHYCWVTWENLLVVPGLIVVGSFAVPFATLILFFELNTPRNVSVVRLIQLLGVGGAVSIVLSLFLFDLTMLDGLFGAPAAGIIEEAGKLAAVLLAMRLIPMDRYPYRLNALLFGAAIGTGFAAFESAGYAFLIALVDGSDAMIDTITIRGVMSPFAHIAWTAIATSAYWVARRQHQDLWATLGSRQFLMLFSVPVALHFVWNMDFEGPLMAKYWVLGFVAWVVLFSLIQAGLRELRTLTGGEEGGMRSEERN